MPELYYTPPDDALFNELKQAAIELWKEVSYHIDYAQEKIDRIKDLENVSDNFIYMVVMFDYQNQHKLAHKISAECRHAIRERLDEDGSTVNVFHF